MNKLKTENNNESQTRKFIEYYAPKIVDLKYEYGDKQFTFKVFPVLPFTKRMEMIKEIVDGVFIGGKNSVNGYAPEFLTFLRRYTVIKNYTDLNLPKKIDDIWLVLNYTPIYNDVVKAVGEDEIKDVFDAADKAIDTYRQYVAAKTDMHSLFDKIGETLSGFEGKLSEEALDELASKAKELTNGSSSNLTDIIGSLVANKDVKENT